MLAALWSRGEAQTPAQVQEALSGGAGERELAYTSVLTTLSRLHAKGLVEREARGRGHAYRPTAGAAQLAADRMRALLGAGTGRAEVLNHFVAGLSDDDETMLRDVLAADAAARDTSSGE